MSIDDLAADIEVCLEESENAIARLRLAQSIILNREEMGATLEETALYASLLVKDSLGWLETCKDLLAIWPGRMAEHRDTNTPPP